MFADEFHSRLSFKTRGYVGSANLGERNSNGSQFFITFKTCRHLDMKHSVFGRVVGGMDVLNAMEVVEVDSKDRPKETLKILRCDVFVNPYEEIKVKKDEKKNEKKKKRKQNQWGVRSFNDFDHDEGDEVVAMKKRRVEKTSSSSMIGKYLKL